MFILAQILGVIALVLELIAFQFKKKKPTLICQSLDAFFYLLQYLCLGAFSGCVTKGLVIVRNFCVVRKDQKEKDQPWLMWIFIIAYVVASILTFKAWYSLLPLAAGSIWTVAVWKIKGTQELRFAAIPPTLMWVVYNAIVLSYPGIMSNVLSLISIIIGIYRYRTKHASNKKRH